MRKAQFLQTLLILGASLCGVASVGFAVEGFDQAKNGKFSELKTEYGVLRCDSGEAEVINGGKNSPKCLHMLGGENNQLTLTLDQKSSQEVAFSAVSERWTGSAPFSFSVKAVVNGQEKEIFKGDDKIKTGGINSKIEGRLPVGTESVVFVCTSPEGKGVKLDNLFIMPAIPMKVVSAKAETDVYPIMSRLDYNPVVEIKVTTEGCLKPQTLKGVVLNMTGSTVKPKDVESIDIWKGTTAREYKNGLKVGSIVPSGKWGQMTVKCEGNLDGGENVLWVSVKLKDTADIDGTVTMKPVGIVADKPIRLEGDVVAHQRLGTAIAIGSDTVEGKKIKFTRIPGLVRTKKGSLVAVYDLRYNHMGDLPAAIDVGSRRSTDGGKTWGPLTMCIDDSKIDSKYSDAHGVGDPAILCDYKTGRLWVVALWAYRHSIHSHSDNWDSNAPEDCGQIVMAYSDDDGVTWQKPINMTESLKKKEWQTLFNGPGAGICMKDGTLVFAAQYWEKGWNKGAGTGMESTIIYSKDNGKTWKCGTGVSKKTSEAQVCELSDGSVMITARDENRRGTRVVGVTKDFGETWTLHETSSNKEKGLACPTCQASLIDVTMKKNPYFKRALFFSNPNTGWGRHTMTIKASVDEGMTWPKEHQYLYDKRNCAGYSCLAPIDNKYIGVIYECPQENGAMNFMRIPYSVIFNKSKSVK